MALKVQVLKCGRCGKPRGLTHTCRTRMDRKTKPRRTRLKPQVKVTATCRTCGKPRGLNHTCRVPTDFKKRKAAAARQQAAEQKRRQAAARKAAAAARRQTTGQQTPTAGRTGKAPAHDYRACQDAECARYACRAWREAYTEGRGFGREEGLQDGYPLGYKNGADDGFRTGYTSGLKLGTEEGFRDGYAQGFAAGQAACPLPHR